MRRYCYFLLFLFLCACSESREEAVFRLVKEWTGKEIKFPERSVFTVQGMFCRTTFLFSP